MMIQEAKKNKHQKLKLDRDRVIRNLENFLVSSFSEQKTYTDNELKERIKLFYESVFNKLEISDDKLKSQYIQFIPVKNGGVILLRISDHDIGYPQNLIKGENEIQSDTWLSLYFTRDGCDIEVDFGRYQASGFRDDTEKLQYEINGIHLFRPNNLRKLIKSLIDLFETGDFKMPFKGYKSENITENKEIIKMKTLSQFISDEEREENRREICELVMAAIIKAEKEIAKYKAEQKNKK